MVVEAGLPAEYDHESTMTNALQNAKANLAIRDEVCESKSSFFYSKEHDCEGKAAAAEKGRAELLGVGLEQIWTREGVAVVQCGACVLRKTVYW